MKTEHAQQSFTASAGRGQRFSAVYKNTFTSKVSRALDKPNPELLGQDKPRLELTPWVEYAVNVDFVPFIRGVRGLYKPGPE